MVMLLIIIYSRKFQKIGFMPRDLFDQWKEKYPLFLKNIEESGIKDICSIVDPELPKEETLLLAHSEQYISRVKQLSNVGGYLDFGETIMRKDSYNDALLLVGATLTAGKFAKEGKLTFNPCGGYHHAKTNRASGFCVFNDIAILALTLSKKFRKIAIVDIDLHHGDGTQEILYKRSILKISMHAYGIFPGTGDVNEIGIGAGKGYNINIPLHPGSGDDAAIYGLENVIIPALHAYAPEIIIAQMGTDGHKDDHMQGLQLTYNFYKKFGETIHNIISEYTNNRFVGLGGGGYTPHIAAKAWTIMLSEILKIKTEYALEEPTKNHLDFVKSKVDQLKQLIDWF